MKSFTRFVALSALFLLPIFPLIVANSLFFPFITGKAFFFRILVEIAFASWAILACLDAKYRPKITALTVGVTVFAVITLVADLAGVNPLRSLWSNFERMEGWVTIIHLWGLFMVMSHIFANAEEGKRLWRAWFNVSLVVAFIVSLYGMGQLLGWFAIHQGSTRIDASLGNAIYMAVYMLFHIFMSAYMFFDVCIRATKSDARIALQWIYGLLPLLFAFTLFETATRGTTLGLLGGLLLALFIYAVAGRGEPAKARYACAGIIVAILIAGGVFWIERNSAFVQKYEVLRRFASISWQENQTQARGYVWPMALKGFMQKPVLGWGQENFNYVFNANYNPKMWAQEQWFDRAHNVFLDWLIASGALGLISYLALYVLAIIAIWKSPLPMSMKTVMTGLITAYAGHNVFVFDELASYLPFFAILAFVNTLRPGKPVGFLGDEPASPEIIHYVVAPICVLALLAALYFVDARPMAANMRLIAAGRACSSGHADAALFSDALAVDSYMADQEIREQLILSCSVGIIRSTSYPNTIKEDFFKLVTSQIQAQIAATPDDARAYFFGGIFMNEIGQLATGQPLLEKAHALSPAKQSISLELSNDYLGAEKFDQAIALLKTAYESATDNTIIRLAYASALVGAGREAEAKKIFGNDPAVFVSSEMAQAYAVAKQYDRAIGVLQKLLAANPTDINLRIRLSQIQYMAGMVSQSIQTMRSIEQDHPEYKDQIEAQIKSIQK